MPGGFTTRIFMGDCERRGAAATPISNCYRHPGKIGGTPLIMRTPVPRPITRFARCCRVDTLPASLSNVSNSRLTTKSRGALPSRLTPSLSDLLRKWRPVVSGPGAPPSRQASGPTTIPEKPSWISGRTSYRHRRRHRPGHQSYVATAPAVAIAPPAPPIVVARI
jgi:hypothetical protein